MGSSFTINNWSSQWRDSENKMRMRESDQLQTVLATYEQEINQDQSKPSCQNVKTMVKGHTDQKIRKRIFQARNERIETGVWVKTQTGKNVGAEKKSGDGKQKGHCKKRDACSFRHDDSKRGKVTQTSSLAPRPQTQSDGRSSSKGKSPRGPVLLEKDPEDYIDGNCTNPSCDNRRPPVCQKLQNWIGMQIRRKVHIQAQRGWQSAQQEAGERWWKKMCCLSEELEAIKLRNLRKRAAEIQVDFTEGPKISWDRNAACTSHKVSDAP